MHLGEFVKSFRDEHELSMDEFAKKSGLSKGYISMLEKNKNPRTGDSIIPSIDTIKKVSLAIGVSFDEIFNHLDDQDVKISPREPSINITAVKNIFPIETKRFPLLGTVACGEPVFDAAYFESYVNGGDINADFCLKCKGDSMVGARIEDGDLVFIHEQPDVENGEIAAVIIDDEATLKRVNKNTPGFIFLMPENSNYEPIVINLSEENEFHSIRILGKAVAFQGDVK
ncbi:helix-turn-helix domain-containing protein [Eubacterium aggregans]|uniref:helix-turn-helix domain-containing protein n=1 Tax=Eubacterium aggregans TaxID=81409 RepID=UPI003F3874A0